MNSGAPFEQQSKLIMRRASLNVPIQNCMENKLALNLQFGQVKKFPQFDSPQPNPTDPNKASDPAKSSPQKITGLEFARDKVLEPSNVQPLGFGAKKTSNGSAGSAKVRRGSHDFITTTDIQTRQNTPKLALDAMARKIGNQPPEQKVDSPVKKFRSSALGTKSYLPADDSFMKISTVNFSTNEKKEEPAPINSPVKITNNLDYIRRKKPVIVTGFKMQPDQCELASPLRHPEEVYSTLKRQLKEGTQSMIVTKVRQQPSPTIKIEKPTSQAIPVMPTLIFRKKAAVEEPKCISARLQACQRFPQSYSPVKRPKKPPCLDDFMVGKKLGKGKYGDVFAVKHKQLGWICAMKVIAKSLIKQQNIQQQFVRQLKIQCYLTHANITAMYGYFDDAENVYLLLEICYDGHLLRILKERERGRLPEKEAREIVKQICTGLEYIHRQKVLHRDIKPENIIIHQGLYKLCDFGWARYTQNQMSQTFCGSPLYVSPQILKGELYNDKIDIWSIGVLTYEMLFGKPPFKINSQHDLNRIITDQITFPEYVEVSAQAKQFITRILKKNPQQRYDIDELLEHPFLRNANKQGQQPLIDFGLSI